MRKILRKLFDSKPPDSKMDNDKAELLDAKAVGQILRVTRRHVYRLMNKKQIPQPLRVGGVLRWRRIELQEWLSAGAPRPTGTPGIYYK